MLTVEVPVPCEEGPKEVVDNGVHTDAHRDDDAEAPVLSACAKLDREWNPPRPVPTKGTRAHTAVEDRG